MSRIRTIIGLCSAAFTVLSLLPATALAEEAQPYESVEHPESGVTVYHNKDGTDTMVVESEQAAEEASTEPDRLANTGEYLTNEGNTVDGSVIKFRTAWQESKIGIRREKPC